AAPHPPGTHPAGSMGGATAHPTTRKGAHPMPMHYSDPTRTEQAHALPDVETFRAALLACDECGTDTIIPTDRSTYADCPTCGETGVTNNVAWYWRPC